MEKQQHGLTVEAVQKLVDDFLAEYNGNIPVTLQAVADAVGLECKHAGPFAKTARAVGLKGKLTATYAEPGTELHDALTDLSRELGDYPHKAMAPRKKPAQPKGWFLVKLVSPNDPGYKFTIAPRLIEEYGMPKDFLGDEMIVAEE